MVLLGMAVAAAWASACEHTLRGLGEQCLKNEDCASGLCSQMTCVANPMVLDAAGEAASDAEPEDASDVQAPGDAAATDADGGSLDDAGSSEGGADVASEG